jgi:hypothetical protein
MRQERGRAREDGSEESEERAIIEIEFGWSCCLDVVWFVRELIFSSQGLDFGFRVLQMIFSSVQSSTKLDLSSFGEEVEKPETRFLHC